MDVWDSDITGVPMRSPAEYQRQRRRGKAVNYSRLSAYEASVPNATGIKAAGGRIMEVYSRN